MLLGGFPGEWEGEHPLEVVRETGDPDVFLAGWRGHEDLPAGLNAADLLVLPSVREQFGAVLVEAMACGLPVVAVDAHGPAEIVDDGETGWLVPPDDEEAMAEALVEAVNGDAERRRRGERAYEEARARYAWPALAPRPRPRVRGGARGHGRRPRGAHTLASTRMSSIAVPDPPLHRGRATRASWWTAPGVEVVVPQRFAAARGGAVRGGEAALDRAHAAADARVRGSSCRRRALEDGGEVPYLGERLRAAGARGARPRARARGAPRRRARRARGPARRRRAARRARALVPAPGARGGRAPRLDAAVRPRRRALHARSRSAASARRWASCSSSGAMSFNWRLLLAPAEILDYVVEHEVAHLEVHDHSERFWALLAERCPDWREHERWLRRHGHALRL